MLCDNSTLWLMVLTVAFSIHNFFLVQKTSSFLGEFRRKPRYDFMWWVVWQWLLLHQTCRDICSWLKFNPILLTDFCPRQSWRHNFSIWQPWPSVLLWQRLWVAGKKVGRSPGSVMYCILTASLLALAQGQIFLNLGPQMAKNREDKEKQKKKKAPRICKNETF